MNRLNDGFTLIELMITVAIVGILAAIAIPNYQTSVMKSRRADAKGALMNFANTMERHFTENNSYCNAGGTGGANDCGDADATFDTGTSSIYSPPSSTATYYTFKIDAASANTYTLTAAPVSTSAQADDECGTLSLNSVGQRDALVNNVSVNDTLSCW